MLILALITLLAAPQDSAAGCSFDTSAHLRTDSILITLATGSRMGPGSALENEYADAAEVIHEYFVPPAQLSLPIWARAYWTVYTHLDTDDPAHGFDRDVQFQLDSAARLLDRSITIATLSQSLAVSVAAAIRRADSARAFARPSPRLLKDDGLIRLHFSTPQARDPHVPLVRVIVPALRLDRIPAVDWVPRVQYPPALLRAKVAGRVVLQFVVDTAGHVDPTTLAVVQSHYSEFADEASRVIQGARFRPAKIGKCMVPVLVRVPLDFRTEQPASAYTERIFP